jgi:hypothetical protein
MPTISFASWYVDNSRTGIILLLQKTYSIKTTLVLHLLLQN